MSQELSVPQVAEVIRELYLNGLTPEEAGCVILLYVRKGQITIPTVKAALATLYEKRELT